jgi:hypothetical protein
VRPRDRERVAKIDAGLVAFERAVHPLPGVRTPAGREAFLEQIIESVHRVEYISVLLERDISESRANPNDEQFDPIKAAILHQRRGNINEAYWLVFLSVHFGRHRAAGWRYAREVYGRLEQGGQWDWPTTSRNPTAFRAWLHANLDELERGSNRGFGNHRKYQSFNAYGPTGTGAAVATYVDWVGPPRMHQELVDEALDRVGRDPRRGFNELYRSMNAVASFGRTAKFDYLTMVGKLRLAPIEPGSTYMQGATGPVAGAKLLFGAGCPEVGHLSMRDLERRLLVMDRYIEVGMQVLEDALCNWQKSPGRFRPFRG